MSKPSPTRGAKIKALRKARRLTQTQLARQLGIETQGTISNWENNKVEIEPGNLLKLVDFFKVPASELGYELPEGATGEPAWLSRIEDKLDVIVDWIERQR